MRISYDYTELIEELHEELRDDTLSLDSHIQILRSPNEIWRGYRPIIDWYYEDSTMRVIGLDDEDRVSYQEDKPHLIEATVGDVLKEVSKFSDVLNVHDLIELTGKSITELSEQSDIKYTTLTDLYKGNTSLDKIRLGTASKLAKALGISLDDLYKNK